MSKGQVNLIRQLKKLLGNAHADINNINLQKNRPNILWKTIMTITIRLKSPQIPL